MIWDNTSLYHPCEIFATTKGTVSTCGRPFTFVARAVLMRKPHEAWVFEDFLRMVCCSVSPPKRALAPNRKVQWVLTSPNEATKPPDVVPLSTGPLVRER